MLTDVRLQLSVKASAFDHSATQDILKNQNVQIVGSRLEKAFHLDLEIREKIVLEQYPHKSPISQSSPRDALGWNLLTALTLAAALALRNTAASGPIMVRLWFTGNGLSAIPLARLLRMASVLCCNGEKTSVRLLSG